MSEPIFLTMTELGRRCGVDLFEIRRRLQQAGLLNDELFPTLEAFGQNICRLKWRDRRHRQHVWTWSENETLAALRATGLAVQTQPTGWSRFTTWLSGLFAKPTPRTVRRARPIRSCRPTSRSRTDSLPETTL